MSNRLGARKVTKRRGRCGMAGAQGGMRSDVPQWNGRRASYGRERGKRRGQRADTPSEVETESAKAAPAESRKAQAEGHDGSRVADHRTVPGVGRITRHPFLFKDRCFESPRQVIFRSDVEIVSGLGCHPEQASWCQNPEFVFENSA